MYLIILYSISTLSFKTLTLFKLNYYRSTLLVLQLYMWPEDGRISHILNITIKPHNSKISYDEFHMIFSFIDVTSLCLQQNAKMCTLQLIHLADVQSPYNDLYFHFLHCLF